WREPGRVTRLRPRWKLIRHHRAKRSRRRRYDFPHRARAAIFVHRATPRPPPRALRHWPGRKRRAPLDLARSRRADSVLDRRDQHRIRPERNFLLHEHSADRRSTLLSPERPVAADVRRRTSASRPPARWRGDTAFIFLFSELKKFPNYF